MRLAFVSLLRFQFCVEISLAVRQLRHLREVFDSPCDFRRLVSGEVGVEPQPLFFGEEFALERALLFG